MKRKLQEAFDKNPALIKEVLKKLFEPVYREDCEHFLTEINRVGIDATKIKETFRSYAYFDALLSEAEGSSREYLLDWEKEITQTLEELQKRRYQELRD